MLDLHNLLNKFVGWINSIGEPKVIQHSNDGETITAIKVKKNKPLAVTNHSYVVTGLTSQVKTTKPKSVSSDIHGYTGESFGNFQLYNQAKSVSSDIHGYTGYASTASYASEPYFTEMPEDLKDLLGSGSNVAPVDINEMYNNPYRKAAPPPYSHSLMGMPGTPGLSGEPGVSGTKQKKSKKKTK